MSEIDVSVIIVSYNTCQMTKECIESIVNNTRDISYEIIVSDNASVDGSVEMIKTEFPEIFLIENDKNLGFGAANNIAIDNAHGKYLFLLNSDTKLLNNAIKYFFEYFELHEDEIGALGAYLINTQNFYIHSFGAYPTVGNMFSTLFRGEISFLIGRFKKKKS